MEDVLAFKSTFHGLVAGWKGMCPQGIELLVYEFSSSILVSILDSIPLSNFFCQTRLHTMVASSVYWVWEQLQELAESSLVFLSLNVSARFDQTRKVFHEFAYHLKSMRIRALFNWNAKSQARSNVHRLHASVASRDAEAEAVSWASRFHISGWDSYYNKMTTFLWKRKRKGGSGSSGSGSGGSGTKIYRFRIPGCKVVSR